MPCCAGELRFVTQDSVMQRRDAVPNRPRSHHDTCLLEAQLTADASLACSLANGRRGVARLQWVRCLRRAHHRPQRRCRSGPCRLRLLVPVQPPRHPSQTHGRLPARRCGRCAGGFFDAGRFKGGDTTPLGTQFGGTFKVNGFGLTAGYRWEFAPLWSVAARAGVASVRTRFDYANTV